MKFKSLSVAIAVASFSGAFFSNVSQADNSIEEVKVIGEQLFADTTRVSPSSSFTEAELEILNIVNAEDAIAQLPGVAIRKRFIGDANGVLGIRGSNMFQTSRSMVFVDGMPLHNHLRTRFNGSPRWSLISPDEISVAQVVYGPYSAEYSGNAMGGVVNIETRRPQARRFTFEAGYFSQDFSYLAADESYNGYRTYIAYEDTLTDKISALFSYTRLENDSQPQTFFFASPNGSPSRASTATAASGFIADRNEYGDSGVYFGDTGPEKVTTDLFRSKWFVDLDNTQLRATVAYEDRNRDANKAVSYLRDADGNTIYDRRVDVAGGQIDTSRFFRSQFQGRISDRESLLVGLGASFTLTDDWVADIFYSVFDVIKDREVRTAASPNASDFSSTNAGFRGRLTEFDDTGWQVFDLKAGTENLFGDARQRLSVGAHYSNYEFALIANDFNSISGVSDADELDGDRATGRADSGGEAGTTAIFAQYGYALNDQFDLSLGLRYEDWETKDGYLAEENLPKRDSSKFSPKFSFAYSPNEKSELRYSAAKAVRFPIVEELYVNNADVSGGNIADPNLNPEEGVFHSLTYSVNEENLSYRFNLFYDTVKDVIFNQTETNGETTFLPVGEVTTKGAEFEISASEVMTEALDLRFNFTYTDAEITENVNNPAFVGKDFPRIPEYRANLIARYAATEKLDLGASVRYASDNFGDLDNRDTNDGGFGSFTSYTFVGVKAKYRLTDELILSAGIDNLFNEEAFVHHPYPYRTYYLSLKYVVE